MKRDLVIVESPAKAKTIGRYLGEKYRIAASVGHIRDLPSAIFGVDVKKDFAPKYIPMKGKDKIIKELISFAADSDKVYIATDPDREGEAIAWHISTILHIDPASACRISFNEITQTAVKAAIEHPRPIDMDLVNAQQARRILDRLVGYELSPLLWKKIKKGLSAGRVQSVATRLVVDKEEEIQRLSSGRILECNRVSWQDPERSRVQGEILWRNRERQGFEAETFQRTECERCSWEDRESGIQCILHQERQQEKAALCSISQPAPCSRTLPEVLVSHQRKP